MSETPLVENLKLQSLNYLKMPKAFKDKYPGWKTSPSPKAKLHITDDTISLCYVWNRTDLETPTK